MIVRKGYKYRLKPDAKTKQKFAQHAGACRFVWNKVLATNEDRYISNTPRIGFAAGCKYLTRDPFWKPRRSGRGGKKGCPNGARFFLNG